MLSIDFVVQAIGGVVGNGNSNIVNDDVFMIIVWCLGLVKLIRSIVFITTITYASMIVEYCALLG